MDNLFAFFNAMNSGDFNFVDSLSDEDVKSLSPFVLLMWCSSPQSNTENHVILTNTYVNPHVFTFSKHPRFLLKMFIAANSGMGNTRYKFKKSVSKEESNLIKQIATYYQCGYNEAKDIKKLLSQDDIKELKELYA